MLNGKSILITGATGSFGKAFVDTVFKRYPDVKRLVVFSRDELKQYEMSQRWSERDYQAIRYFLGDVRDASRIKRALEGIDTVIHAAALKQVPAAEYNPFECIKTNVMGAENIIEACVDQRRREARRLRSRPTRRSTPMNLYGATKLCSDKLFVAANHLSRHRRHKAISIVRYGNVIVLARQRR